MDSCDILVHVTPEEGTNSSPKNKNPPSSLRQCPTTFRTTPMLLSCEIKLTSPLPRPRTPAVGGDESGTEYL